MTQDYVFIKYSEMLNVFQSILEREGLKTEKASICAGILADNSLDGVDSHGVLRFENFADRLKNGEMDGDAEPVKIVGNNAFECWDGKKGLGPVNAVLMADRAICLSKEFGVGVVALRNTTHWMRGGTYGQRIASQGCFGICWTNTKANMNAWGTHKEIVGNNPIVFAAPGKDAPVVLDMALSQYSYGKLVAMDLAGQMLPFYGGFDKAGNLTKDPGVIVENHSALPIGYWKGYGLAIMLDIFSSVLSNGVSTVFMPESGHTVSQVFISIHPKTECGIDVSDIIRKLKIECSNSGEDVHFPGEQTIERRRKNLETGIPVLSDVWTSIKKRFEKQ